MTKETTFECGIDKSVEALSEELDKVFAAQESDEEACAYILEKLEGMISEMQQRGLLSHVAVEAHKHLGDMSDEHDRLHAQEHHLHAEIIQSETKLLRRFIEYVRGTLIEKDETMTKSLCKPYTPEQIRDHFLQEIYNRAQYWAREGKDKQDAVDGIVFSILSILDGSTNLPPFHIAPVGTEDGKAFYEEEEADGYYPLNEDLDIPGEFGHLGQLHELWTKKKL